MAEFELGSKALVQGFEGFGVQYNQNIYAPLCEAEGVTPQNVLGMERKVKALRPHLVRIFFDQEALSPSNSDLLHSFERTMLLAQQSASSINVTWAGGGAKNPDASMGRFAKV